MNRIVFSIILILISSYSCIRQEEKIFSEISPRYSGVKFANNLSNSPNLNILNYLYYYNGAGTISADFNNDNLIDLYFVGNQISDELYLNKGDFKFERVTEISGIFSSEGWSTGATQVDINNDGYLDIYLCKASGYRNLKGKNLLYINQGPNDKGIPIFEEKASDYGLDFEGLSTTASFFDFDIDGDLDMYLLNHSVHPNRTYGRGSQRTKIDTLSGDRLYQNNNGHFIDISSKAGIFQGKSGYGLGISISDINNDGYPDIYVGNDFYENDYLYINQQNGTFQEIISADSERIGHTTHFSMGNDIADINNDGFMDIISLDMLPENLETYKTSGLEYAYPIYRQYLNQGFSPQYMQNTLHLNLKNGTFAEISNLAGLSATEWSWGALFADFDNDGFNDVFISNGIKGATNDMDYMNFIANDAIQKRIDAGMTNSDMPLIDELPEKKVSNYFFKNNGDLTFSNSTESWFTEKPTFSNGTTYADLDNDGDLDIVVNNIDDNPLILKNNSTEGNHLIVKLKGSGRNRHGIGAKITAFVNNKIMYREQFTSKGYLSSTSNKIHFGIGKDSLIDSLKVVWPDGLVQTRYKVTPNKVINLNQVEANSKHDYSKNSKSQNLKKIDSLINFVHKEQVTLDFDREPLIPFAASNQGPNISIIDFNQDGLDDVFITGGKNQASELHIQSENGTFKVNQETNFELHRLHEDLASSFFDADNDGDIDLLIASGGNEFKSGKPIEPRLYINEKGNLSFKESNFKGISINASKIIANDFDKDGDIDVFITSDIEPLQYGKTPKQYIFLNDGTGNFEDVTALLAPEFEFLGNVKDLVFNDINNDDLIDFVAVGHWMPISIFINNGTEFRLQKNNQLSNTNGWWNTVKARDFDNDGDVDIIAGNWGLNTKFKSSVESPLTLYSTDFDDNGSIEPLVTYFHKGVETPFASKDDLVKQMPFLNKKYLSYSSFAKASIKELFGENKLEKAKQKKVFELKSCFFKNNGTGGFLKRALPLIAQSSIIYDIAIEDFNNDGFNDLLIVGNDFEISTQLGRLDALHGVILQNDKKGDFYWDTEELPDINGAARTIKEIEINGAEHYMVGINSKAPIFLSKKKSKQ